MKKAERERERERQKQNGTVIEFCMYFEIKF